MTQTVTSSVAASGLSGTIPIGALLDQTGAISTGIRTLTGIQMGVADVNSWLASIGITNLQFSLKYSDTQTNPAVALTDMQTLAAQGVKVFIGPGTTAEASNVLSFANSNHIVVLTTGTAASLAVPNDYLFRIVPQDNKETVALASLVYQKGYSCALTLWRGDSWGVPFSQAFDSAYTTLGGKIMDNLTYTPVAGGTIDFTVQLTQMQSDFNKAATSCGGASKVAVVAMQFGELAAALSQAANYSPLNTAQWFTDDTEVNDATFVQAAGAQALAVKMYGMVWAPTTGPRTLAMQLAYNKTIGNFPSAFTMGDYDGVWLAALSILLAGKYDGAAIQQAVIPASQTFFGITGYMGMDANGDRGVTDYNVFEVNTVKNAPGWQNVGVWSFTSQLVTYNSNVRP